MTMFMYQQEQKVLEPLEFVLQIKSGRDWVNIGKPCKNYSAACALAVRCQRKFKGNGKGRILAQGIVSKHSWSITKRKF